MHDIWATGSSISSSPTPQCRTWMQLTSKCGFYFNVTEANIQDKWGRAIDEKQKAYHFHQEWETYYFFASVNTSDRCARLICGTSVAVGKKSNVERHFITLHKKFDRDFPSGSSLRSAKVSELKVGLQRQQLFTKPVKGAEAPTEASFKVAHHLAKKKKIYRPESTDLQTHNAGLQTDLSCWLNWCAWRFHEPNNTFRLT